MLNSLQIRAALKRRGFTPDIVDAYAHGYHCVGQDEPIFVKLPNGDADSKPVFKAPLVLHPSLESDVRKFSQTARGIEVEVDHYFSTSLGDFPKRLHKGQSETAYGVAVGVEDEQALDTLLKHLISGEDPSMEAFAQASVLTTSDFKDAFVKLESRMTSAQRQMLLAHANADAQCLSMERLAAIGGYDSFSAANMQYGRLGGMFADQLGIRGLSQKTQMLACASADKDDQGHWQWRLRPQLFDALVELGLVKSEQHDPTRTEAEAAAEIDSDPLLQDIPETTRQALINARVGQDAYRRRLLALWGRQCAVTGCTVEQVLVASHAHPWAESDDKEKLDEYNGLLLAASVDRLFDGGLISFDAEGRLLCKPSLTPDQLAAVGLTPTSCLRHIDPRHERYLAKHRKRHGFESS